MVGRRSVLACFALILLTGFPISVHAQEPENPTLDSPGFRGNGDYFFQMPFESIDTSSGGLI